MNYDRWAEGGLALRAWNLPEEALNLFQQAPAKLFGSNVVCVARALPVAIQRGLVPTWMNLRNIAGEFGYGVDYCEAAFRVIISSDSVFMSGEPERCILSIREAYLERSRSQAVRELEKLRGDPREFRSKLEQMLRMEQAIAPSQADLPKVESVEELEAAEVEYQEAVLGEYLLNQTGLGFIHAADGAGKTLLAMDLAACIATGKTWLGWGTVRSRVLYFQGELDRGWWKQRNTRLRAAHGEIPNLKWCHERWSLGKFDSKTWQTTTPGLDKLQRMIELHKPDVVFIDPLSKYYGLQENSNDQANEFVGRLRDLRAALGVSFVIVHHDGKAQDGKPATMRGASAMRGDSDLSIQLVVRDEGKYVNLIFDKVRHGPKPAPIKLGRNKHGFFERLSEDDSDSKKWKGTNGSSKFGDGAVVPGSEGQAELDKWE